LRKSEIKVAIRAKSIVEPRVEREAESGVDPRVGREATTTLVVRPQKGEN